MVIPKLILFTITRFQKNGKPKRHNSVFEEAATFGRSNPPAFCSDSWARNAFSRGCNKLRSAREQISHDRNRDIEQPLWSGRRTQAMPGITYLLIMHLRKIIGGVEVQRFYIEPADGAEQCIGSNNTVALGTDEPSFG